MALLSMTDWDEVTNYLADCFRYVDPCGHMRLYHDEDDDEYYTWAYPCDSLDDLAVCGYNEEEACVGIECEECGFFLFETDGGGAEEDDEES